MSDERPTHPEWNRVTGAGPVDVPALKGAVLRATYRDVCEALAAFVGAPSWEAIFNLSPSGELWHIHEAYWEGRRRGMAEVIGFEPEPLAALPSEPVAGQIVKLQDGSVHCWVGSWSRMLP